MKNITIITLLFFISFFYKSFAIEVSSLEAEKKLEFSELFPKKICNKIYEASSFGKENKLSEEVELKYNNVIIVIFFIIIFLKNYTQIFDFHV